jgi:hypothetical protein
MSFSDLKGLPLSPETYSGSMFSNGAILSIVPKLSVAFIALKSLKKEGQSIRSKTRVKD